MIDWKKAREAVERFADGPSRRSDSAILSERAVKLALVHTFPARPSAAIEVVLFELSGESFGLEAALVIEVFRVSVLTPLPEAPSFVRGLTNRLGLIVPVLDLAPMIGLEAIRNPAAARCLLLGRERRPDFGLLVSDVAGVGLVPEEDLRPLPEGGGRGAARDFVRGVTADALIVLDGDRILDDSRLLVKLDL